MHSVVCLTTPCTWSCGVCARWSTFVAAQAQLAVAETRRAVLQLFAQWPTQLLEFDPLLVCPREQLFPLLKLAYASGGAARNMCRQSLQLHLSKAASIATATAGGEEESKGDAKAVAVIGTDAAAEPLPVYLARAAAQEIAAWCGRHKGSDKCPKVEVQSPHPCVFCAGAAWCVVWVAEHPVCSQVCQQCRHRNPQRYRSRREPCVACAVCVGVWAWSCMHAWVPGGEWWEPSSRCLGARQRSW